MIAAKPPITYISKYYQTFVLFSRKNFQKALEGMQAALESESKVRFLVQDVIFIPDNHKYYFLKIQYVFIQ